MYAYSTLEAMEIVLKILRCEVEIIESDTIMNFLADERVSDNEAIVLPPKSHFIGRKWTNCHLFL